MYIVLCRSERLVRSDDSQRRSGSCEQTEIASLPVDNLFIKQSNESAEKK